MALAVLAHMLWGGNGKHAAHNGAPAGQLVAATASLDS